MIIVLVGESGSGKSTIEKMIIERNPNISKIIPYTTRLKRENEKNGLDYFFIDKECFFNKRKLNDFIEEAEYNGWYYGTTKDAYNDDKDHVVTLTPSGCRKLKQWAEKEHIKVISIYLNTDRRTRLIRLLNRGDNIEEAYRRNLSELGQFDGFEDETDYVITNFKNCCDIEEVYSKVDKIIEKENNVKFLDFFQSKRNKEYINEFCEQLKNIWTSVPQLRFAQLISNSFGKIDLFYKTDEIFLKQLEDYTKKQIRSD